MDYQGYIFYLQHKINNLMCVEYRNNKYNMIIESLEIIKNQLLHILEFHFVKNKETTTNGKYQLNLQKYEKLKDFHFTDCDDIFINYEELIAVETNIENFNILNKEICPVVVEIKNNIANYYKRISILDKTYKIIFENHAQTGYLLHFDKSIWDDFATLDKYIKIFGYMGIDWSLNSYNNILTIKYNEIDLDILSYILLLHPNCTQIIFTRAILKNLVLDDIKNIQNISTIIFESKCNYNEFKLKYSGGVDGKHQITTIMLIDNKKSELNKFTIDGKNLILDIKYTAL